MLARLWRDNKRLIMQEELIIEPTLGVIYYFVTMLITKTNLNSVESRMSSNSNNNSSFNNKFKLRTRIVIMK